MAAVAASVEFPPLSGRVVDAAGILPADVQAEISRRSAAIEAASGAQMVVVTVASLQGMDIADYGYRLGRHWGIGEHRRAGAGDNGVILLVAPNERLVRIEVGYGLEPVLTDALANRIIQQQILPRFRAGRLPDGILAGASAMADVLELALAEAGPRQQPAPAISTKRRSFPFGIAFFVMLIVWLGLARSRARHRRKRPPVERPYVPPAQTQQTRRPHRRAGLWAILLGGRHDDDDRWGGGGGFGGGGFGGGFRGGGGGFGGGGASGRW